MAAGSTAVGDIIVPEIFTPAVVQKTEEKSRLIKSGALVKDGVLDALLAGAGLTFELPSFKPLDNEAENVSSDDTDDTFQDDWNAVTGAGIKNSRPKKTGMVSEIGVRLSRNQSWASADLAAALGQKDPVEAIQEGVSDYWALRLQAAFVATMKGVFADNDAAPGGSEHVQYDMTNDVKGGAFTDGVTNFTTEAFMDAAITMGDSADVLGLVMVHSVVFNRMKKLQLIDFIPDATNPAGANLPTYQGKLVIVDDGMPFSSGVYESWLFGSGAVRLGVSSPKNATETERKPGAGNGGGQDVLYNRVEWMIHPVGHKYAGTAPKGGPGNGTGSNELAAAASWQRVFPQRKQIKIARLITREHA